MQSTIQEDTRIVDVTVSATPDTTMSEVFQEFERVRKNRIENSSNYLAELMAFPPRESENGSSFVKISLMLVEWGVLVDDIEVSSVDKDSVEILEELPYGDSRSVEKYFAGRWEEPVYI